MNLDQGGDSEARFAAYGAGLGALSVTRIGRGRLLDTTITRPARRETLRPS
jgi:hypothetical protein